jgi:hypothetical protein
MVAKGKLPESYESLLAECDASTIASIEIERVEEDKERGQ